MTAPKHYLNTTQPASWISAFKAQAKEEGVSLSEWVGIQCAAGLSGERRFSLTERVKGGRPLKTPTG